MYEEEEEEEAFGKDWHFLVKVNGHCHHKGHGIYCRHGIRGLAVRANARMPFALGGENAFRIM